MFTSPVFVAEMLVSSRRARYFALRVVLGLILLVVLYQNVTINKQFNAAGANNLSNAANTFFQSFAVFELMAIAMLGPALSAGAIAVERERRTLEYLLVTDFERLGDHLRKNLRPRWRGSSAFYWRACRSWPWRPVSAVSIHCACWLCRPSP